MKVGELSATHGGVILASAAAKIAAEMASPYVGRVLTAYGVSMFPSSEGDIPQASAYPRDARMPAIFAAAHSALSLIAAREMSHESLVI